MKRITMLIICLMSICIVLCGCDYDDSEYDDLNAQLEDYEEQIGDLENNLADAKSSLDVVLNYIKSSKTSENVEFLKYSEIWSVNDYFDFSFYYDNEFGELSYNIKDKSGNPIQFIYEENPKIQELLIAVFSSDGELETYYAIGDSENLFLVPEYNYSYEIMLFAKVDNTYYRANYIFSAGDIK